jgi:cytochrome c556
MNCLVRVFVASSLLVGAAFVVSCTGPEHARTQSPQVSQMARAVSLPKRTNPPEYLSSAAKFALEKRMKLHAGQMGGLVSAIMILDYPIIGVRADVIASDASLSRPLEGDAAELNSALPEKFFVYQDELRSRARTLAAASRTEDPYAVADAYGRLSEACVRCHAVYRQGR